MTAGKSSPSQSKLLPYLLLALALLLGYLVYTRLTASTTATTDSSLPAATGPAPAPGAPAAPEASAPAPGGVASPAGPAASAPTSRAQAPSAAPVQPAGTQSTTLSQLLPKDPVGRADPFVSVGGVRSATAAPGGRPTAPLPPAVPPPFFPGRGQPGAPGGPGGAIPGPGQEPLPQLAARAVGILESDSGTMALLAIGDKTHIVRVGDTIEGFRVATIDTKRVVLRQGSTEVVALMGGDEKK